jgi:succinate-acetate transporter protein
VHGTWGSFWIAYGIYQLLIALTVLPGLADPGAASALGFWFVVLAAITWVGAVGALAESGGLAGVLVLLAAGSTLLAVGLLAGVATVQVIGAYILIISAILAWYTASAMLLNHTFKRAVLPVGKRGAPESPADPDGRAIQYPFGEPGVTLGQ